MTTASDLWERRRGLISALRSGDYEKGTGSLAKVDYLIRGPHGHPKVRFCCIGVGRNELDSGVWRFELIADNPNEEDEREHDEEADYEQFEDYYDVEPRLRYYLMAMNDGMYMYVESHREPQLTTISNAYVAYPRNNDIQREFTFIARFLELVWK